MESDFILKSTANTRGELGFVYLIKNPAFPHLLKIGYTTRSVEERLKELNSSTALPDKFEIIFKFLCEKPYEVEQKIHNYFSQFRFRENREFFKVKAEDVICFLVQNEVPKNIISTITSPFKSEINELIASIHEKDLYIDVLEKELNQNNLIIKDQGLVSQLIIDDLHSINKDKDKELKNIKNKIDISLTDKKELENELLKLSKYSHNLLVQESKSKTFSEIESSIINKENKQNKIKHPLTNQLITQSIIENLEYVNKIKNKDMEEIRNQLDRVLASKEYLERELLQLSKYSSKRFIQWTKKRTFEQPI